MAKDGPTRKVWHYLIDVAEQIDKAINKEQKLIKDRSQIQSDLADATSEKQTTELKAAAWDNEKAIEKSRHIARSGEREIVSVIVGAASSDDKLFEDLPDRWRAPAFKPKAPTKAKDDVPGQLQTNGEVVKGPPSIE